MEIIIEQLQQRLTTLEAKMVRQERALRKLKRDMIPEDQRKPRKPSGFAKPTYLSPVLCKFLEVSEDTELPRTEVTKRLLHYVKTNELQNEQNHRIIDCDAKLQELLQPSEGESVTYFNIQRLLKVHYNKPGSTTDPTNANANATVNVSPVAAEVTPPAAAVAKKPRAKKTKA